MMLGKNPERRSPSMRGIKNDLEQFREDSGRTGIARIDSNHRWLWAALLLCVLGFAGGFYWFFPTTAERSDAPINYRPVPLTSYPGIERQPTFSPDGSQVAFVWNGENQDNFDIYVKVVGSDPPLRLTDHASTDFSPVWSPNGQQIAFLRSEGRGQVELFLISPVGGTERKITDFEARRNLPTLAWSPDSRLLTFQGEP